MSFQIHSKVGFITVTDTLTSTQMIVRIDQIFRIEDLTDKRKITFLNGESDYVSESIDELLALIIDSGV